MFCLFTPKGWSKWPVKTLCNYKRMWLGKGRHETWYVDWPCRPWDIADPCTLQTCLTEATEGLQSALPPNCPCWSTASPLNLVVTFSSSSLFCDHIPVSTLLFLLHNDGWDCIVLSLHGPWYSLSQQFGGEPVFAPCVGIELKYSLRKQTAEHTQPPSLSWVWGIFPRRSNEM